ncbi:unnamed protein product [Didymodactylos carnosus]|uniref:GH18 domain-containing protein n=1 Tax=Didymodactylos carnosus TaxID=1234261 RepID=A0A814EWR8_9BILA|nr:unnamed protein product [Didymodactylos carnosus]CAF3749854.1 unnamed protein product [Didymodactylos carnosus]
MLVNNSMFVAYQRPGSGSMVPEDIDPCLCTHIIYAFAEMDKNQLTPTEKYDTDDKENDLPGFFERFNQWKEVNKHLRTLLAVGGWEMGMKDFSAMVKQDKNIKKFVDTTIKYLRHHKFDGLDLDFEYPGVDWRGSEPEDKKKFTKLCQMLYEGFKKEAEDTGHERLLLTAAVSGAKTNIDKAYEVDLITPYLDWYHLMTYDYHGNWDTNAGHHSALSGKESSDQMHIDFTVKYYEKLGVPKEKLLVGLATYGRGDTPAMPYTGFKGENGFISYYEACTQITCEKFKETWDQKQLIPFAAGQYNQPKFGFDNVRSMKYKANYIKQMNLGGAFFWTLDSDDFAGKFCCQGKFPLIRTVKAVLHGQLKLLPPEKICEACPSKEYKDVKNIKKPAEKTKTKKPKKPKRDVASEAPSVGTPWGEQKRESCYVGAYFEPNEKNCKWVGQDKLNCEELIEGYESGAAATASKSDSSKEDDDDDDEDITLDSNITTKQKKSSLTSSAPSKKGKSTTTSRRNASEFDTCIPDKPVEFDPVQAFYRYAMLLLRKSEGKQRLSTTTKRQQFDSDLRNTTTNMLQQKNNIRRALCVTIPAVIAIIVCVVIYCAYRNNQRKPHRTLSMPIQNNYLRTNNTDNYQIDFSRTTSRQQRLTPPAPSIIEQLPPSYNSLGQTRRQFPLLTPIRPSRIDRSSTNITPSVYNAMPPSYAEIFLTPENKR